MLSVYKSEYTLLNTFSDLEKVGFLTLSQNHQIKQTLFHNKDIYGAAESQSYCFTRPFFFEPELVGVWRNGGLPADPRAGDQLFTSSLKFSQQ